MPHLFMALLMLFAVMPSEASQEKKVVVPPPAPIIITLPPLSPGPGDAVSPH